MLKKKIVAVALQIHASCLQPISMHDVQVKPNADKVPIRLSNCHILSQLFEAVTNKNMTENIVRKHRFQIEI